MRRDPEAQNETRDDDREHGERETRDRESLPRSLEPIRPGLLDHETTAETYPSRPDRQALSVPRRDPPPLASSRSRGVTRQMSPRRARCSRGAAHRGLACPPTFCYAPELDTPNHIGRVYTFCFAQTSSSDQALRLGRGAVDSVSARLPALGSPPRFEAVELPELGAAFAIVTPEIDVTPSLIQHHCQADLAIITWGSLGGTPDAAGAVREAYQRLGIDGVARLEGNLSAVVVDRAARTVWVAGTLLGHRSLFYHAGAGTFLVSPHDLTLLATGRIPCVLDPVSLASMAATDWSLNGRSLVSGVRRCHPLEAVSWREGELEKRHVSNPFDRPRVDARDRAGIQRQVGSVVESMLRFVQGHVAGLERVRCSLTAGMDSRAMFAALCGVKSASAITAVTSGGESNLDVVIARRLARLVGARHERQAPSLPTAEDFLASTRLRAFLCSGDTNAKRSMSRLPRIDPAREKSAGGNGGEIYRGFFYQYFGLTGEAPQNTEELASRLLRLRFRRWARLPFADPSVRDGVRERLFEALARAESCSKDPYDIADLLYLFERYGRWGSAPANLPWEKGWTPFESIEAIREAFRLPPPVGKRCSVHAELVRRFLPARAYWTPINGAHLMALEGDGRARYAARQLLTGGSMAVQRVRRRLFERARGGDEMRTDFVRGPLHGVTRDLLLEQGSLSQGVFGRGGVEQLIAGAQRDGLAVIGILLTAESWRQLALEVSRASHA